MPVFALKNEPLLRSIPELWARRAGHMVTQDPAHLVPLELGDEVGRRGGSSGSCGVAWCDYNTGGNVLGSEAEACLVTR